MVRIFVITLCSIECNTGRVLFREANFGSAFAWMNLNGEGLIGAQHFKQKRQFTETLSDFLTELLLQIGADLCAQAYFLTCSILDIRAAFRVRTHPQFGHWLAIGISNTVQMG